MRIEVVKAIELGRGDGNATNGFLEREISVAIFMFERLVGRSMRSGQS